MDNGGDAAANGNGAIHDNPGYRLFGSLAEASLIQQRRNGEDPDRADTLPRTTLRATSRTIKLIDPAGDLQEMYDPDSIGKTFYHPAEEITRHAYLPVATKEGRYYDPPAAHRIQTVVGWTKDRKPILKEHIIRSGKDLKALSESREYRRSRLLESTGDWDLSNDPARYRKFVETPLRAAWHEAWKADPKERTRLREASSDDGFSFGGGNGTWNGQDVMGQMNQEFIPIMGGPFCFTGDTRVPLLDGTVRTMEELARDFADASFWVYSSTPDGRIVPGRAHSPRVTGRSAEILEVELDNGKVFRCTPGHLWMLRDGTYRQASELAPGTSLMPLYTKESAKGLKGYELLYQPHLNRFVYTHKGFTGRISKGKVVHHVNFNKRDNRPENLKIMFRSDHQSLHMNNVAWWNDPEKKAAAAQKIGAALKKNNWTQTPEGREFRSAEMKQRYAQGWRPPHIDKMWDCLTEEQRHKISNSPLRRERTAAANRSRVWTPEMRAAASAITRAHYATHELTDKAREALAMGRQLRRNHKVVAVRPAERADVYDFSVDEHDNFALADGAFVHNSKQLYLYAHWEASAKCFEMKNHSEYAKATVDIVTDFALGRGVNWKINSLKAKLIWEEFWQRNKMESRIRQMCDDAVWQGELLIRKTEPLKGFMQVRSQDPSSFYEIVTDPQDLETCYFYHQQFNCLHGDTEIALLDGTHATIRELAERSEPYWVYSYDAKAKRIVPGRASKTWKQGRKRCVKVTLDSGESVIASYDHPFLMRDGRYVEAEKLQPADSLMPLYRRAAHSAAVKKHWREMPESERLARTAHMRESSPVNHRVASVEPAGEHDVYDLQVDEHHNFALACGVFTHNTQYQLPYTDYNGRHLDIPLQQYVIHQIPPTEMWHGKLNVTAYEKWGRSDFFCALGTLKRLRDWTNAATLKDLLQANLVWIVTIHGDDADVQAFVNNSQNAQLPPFAGTVVTNEAVKYESFHQDTAGGSRMGRGSTGEFLIATYACSQHFPSTYFNIGSGGMARATALVASEPVAKKIASRQQFFRGMLDHLYEEVMKRAVEAGRIGASDIAGEDADPEWAFPSTFEEDRGAKFRDLGNATDRRWISHRRAATVGAQELGFEEFDYDEEQKVIAEELQDSTLQAALLPVEPPTPSKPGFGAADGAAPTGGREDVAGADATANFKQDTRGNSGATSPPVKQESGRLPTCGILSESDRELIRDGVRRGARGSAILRE